MTEERKVDLSVYIPGSALIVDEVAELASWHPEGQPVVYADEAHAKVEGVVPAPRKQEDDDFFYILEEISVEYNRAINKFPDTHPAPTAHHMLAVIEEEFLELREEVFHSIPRGPNARKEAIQLAAMALAYVKEISDASF